MNSGTRTQQSNRHSLADWLALHELDTVTCHQLLDELAVARREVPSLRGQEFGYQAPDREAVWLEAVEAMRRFFPGQRKVIDNTYIGTSRIVVTQPSKTRRALTVDNGAGTYPTILYSYDGRPSDALVIAHEFAHALQIAASKGRFVAPVIREVCAFLGESALLSQSSHSDADQYSCLVRAWLKDNQRYLGEHGDTLRAALSHPDEPYKYAWNYPVARYLAMQVSERFCREWIWSIFEGECSVRSVLRILSDLPGDRRLT